MRVYVPPYLLLSKRFSKAPVGLGELDDARRFRTDRIDQLQHPDDHILVILHGYGQEGLRTVVGALVELPRAGKIEALGHVGIGDVDGMAGQCGVSGNHAVVGRAVVLVQGQIGELAGTWLAAGTAESEVQ